MNHIIHVLHGEDNIILLNKLGFEMTDTSKRFKYKKFEYEHIIINLTTKIFALNNLSIGRLLDIKQIEQYIEKHRGEIVMNKLNLI